MNKIVTIDGVRFKLESGNYTMYESNLADYEMLKLVIDPIEMEDQGRYICGNKELQLNVYESDGPKIITKNNDSNSVVEALVNETVSLECQWTGQTAVEPIINWYKVEPSSNQKVLMNDESKIKREREIVENTNVFLSLTLKLTATANDSGTKFLCSAFHRVSNQFELSIETATVQLEIPNILIVHPRPEMGYSVGTTVGIFCIILFAILVYYVREEFKKDFPNAVEAPALVPLKEVHEEGTPEERDKFLKM